jgi:putative redox protein
MASQSFDFQGSRGYRLAGRVEQPEGTARAWAILAHCFTCGKDHVAAARVARTLAAHGIGVLRFDFAGLGASGGSFADTTFAADVDDLVAAGRAMEAAGHAPSLLVGHSLGGAAVLAAADAMPGVRAIATIAAPFDTAHVLQQIDPASLQRIETQGEAEVLLAHRPFIVRRSFVEDLRRHDQGARIAALHRPLLVMHAPGDTTVGIDNANRIFLAARHPKSFVSLDSADHLLSRRDDANYAATVIAAWASRYLQENASA